MPAHLIHRIPRNKAHGRQLGSSARVFRQNLWERLPLELVYEVSSIEG